MVRTLRQRYADALLAGDEAAAEATMRAAMRLGMTAGQIDVELIAPALWQVGDLWEKGEIGVADEHLATEITVRLLVLQREAMRTEQRRAGRRVLLAAPEGERHVVGLRMAADLLHGGGYDTRFLGADVPLTALSSAVERHAPDVVCLTTTMPDSEPMLWGCAEVLEDIRPDAAMLLGGRGLAEDFPERPGVATCRVVADVVGAVDALVQRARLN
jgi:methanogenic corrinoid protein MtbC1